MSNRGKQEKEGRNAPCRCGSGKKYKNCHGKNGMKGGSPIFKTPMREPDAIRYPLRREVELAEILAAEERMKERLTWK